jgi:uncharacterized protein (TIGR01777 family)
VRVAITGATGLIGRTLGGRLLSRGDQIVALARDSARARSALPDARAFAWDALSGAPPVEALAGVEAVVHLAGEPIADRAWSAEQKRRIRDSRIDGTRRLVETIGQANPRPRVLISASAIGYYGDRGDEPLDEQSGRGNDFLADLCADWEAEARRAEALGVRVVIPRTGIVLAREGGALPKLALPFRFFVGGPLGTGRQWMSWIHLADEVGLIVHALDHEEVAGPINLVAPNPVPNAAMAREIGRVLGRPSLMPAPTFALKLALGERTDVLLASQRVAPAVAQRTGYAFRFPELAPALRDLLG